MKKKIIFAIGIIALFIGMATIPVGASLISKDDGYFNPPEIGGWIEGLVYEPGWERTDGGIREKHIGGATVRISSLRHSDETTSRESDGRYYFYDVPVGVYIIIAEHPDYLTLFRGIDFIHIKVPDEQEPYKQYHVSLWLFPKLN